MVIEFAGVDAHRVGVLDRADDDAIVRLVADHLHLEFLPAEHAFLDQDLVGGGGVDAAFDDVDEFALVVGDAPARAAHGEARPDDRRQADVLERSQRLRQRLDVMRAGGGKTDPGHRFAEEFPVLGLVDRLGGCADHLDLVAVEHTHLLEAERAVERRLPAHGRQERESAGNSVSLLGDDFCDDLGRDRLDVGPIRHVGIGHDGGGVRVDEDDPIAFRAQRLAGLRPRIVELAGLADDDRPGADDEDGRDIGALRHSVLFMPALCRRGATCNNGRTKKGRRALGRDASFVACAGRAGMTPGLKRAALSLDDNRRRGKG